MLLTGLFPTTIYHKSLRPSFDRRCNGLLLGECRSLRLADAAGRRWSQKHYPAGYTSYGSHDRLHMISSTFARLDRVVLPHARRFVAALGYDMRGRDLAMTDCWANIMGPGATHSWHLHPLSFISGTYYVSVPDGAAPIKFEDPRLSQFMAAPPRRRTAARELQTFLTLEPKEGDVVLFESWLRHEVPAHRASEERVSISFNYIWRDRAKRK